MAGILCLTSPKPATHIFPIFAKNFKNRSMSLKFNEYKQFDLSQINLDVLALWEKEETFRKSLDERKGHTPYVFYEGPPSRVFS